MTALDLAILELTRSGVSDGQIKAGRIIHCETVCLRKAEHRVMGNRITQAYW